MVRKNEGCTICPAGTSFLGLAPIFADLGLVDVSPYLGLSLRTFGIASILLVFGLATGKIVDLGEIELKSASLLIGEGIFAGLLGHLACFYGIKLGEASRVVPIAIAYPLITFVIGVVLLDQSLSLAKLVGVPRGKWNYTIEPLRDEAKKR